MMLARAARRPPAPPPAQFAPARAPRVLSPPRLAALRPNSSEGPPSAPDPGADAFSLETTQVVLRSVTARAVQRVLARLHSVDRPAYEWLLSFTAAHPPIEGSGFVARLLSEPPVAVNAPSDAGGAPTPRQTRVVNPAQLASAVLITRSELARDVARALEDCAARENVAVLREHLRRHTYTTGNTAAPRLRYGRGGGAGGGGEGVAAAESVALWQELRRRAPPPASGEGGVGGGGGGGGGGGPSQR